MDDVRRQRYALAGAMAVTVGELLKRTHVAAAKADDGAMAAAAAHVQSAAAACSAVVARLLMLERDAARAKLAVLDAPQRPELGVTILEGLPRATWAATVRAVAATGTELISARATWAQASAADLDQNGVGETLTALVGYVDSLAGLLETNEPEGAEVK